MFIGHFALALGAKRVAPAVSLGTLFLAAQLADLVWPTLLLAGVETVEIRPGVTAFTPLDFISYPYSHSLVALLGWALLFAVVYVVVRRGGANFLGPPPPSSVAVAWAAQSMWLLVAWGYWVDRHRRSAMAGPIS